MHKSVHNPPPPPNAIFTVHLVVITVVQELMEVVSAFGDVTHCTISRLLNEAGLHTAYVRSAEASIACMKVFLQSLCKTGGFYFTYPGHIYIYTQCTLS